METRRVGRGGGSRAARGRLALLLVLLAAAGGSGATPGRADPGDPTRPGLRSQGERGSAEESWIRDPVPGTRRPGVVRLLLALGFGAGIPAVLLLRRLDPRLRSPHQVTRDLGLGILGAIPWVKRAGDQAQGPATARAAEAMRELRTSIAFSCGSAAAAVIVVTSPARRDGKSFVTVNLAHSFAEQGRRTLVLDGDTRRGGLHQVLGGERGPGLTDLLAERATLEEILRPTAHPLLTLIACGTPVLQGPELLATPAMARLVAELRGRYDVVLVDSPPLAGGSDALTLATLAGNLLLVLRNGVTDRILARAKLDRLQRLPVRVLGTVMNAISPRGVYRYYSYPYLSEYGLEDEPEEVRRGALAGRRRFRG